MQKQNNKQRYSPNDSVDQSKNRNNDSSQHSSPEREWPQGRDHADQPPVRRNYDKSGSRTRPDNLPQHSGHENSDDEQSQAHK
jgi:hypothetical protein